MAFSTRKENTPILNVSLLSKVLPTTILSSKKNLWLLDFAANACVCNDRSIFLDFIERITALSKVIA